MCVDVSVCHILFTFHLLYILIYSHSILFHSVPFSISFNVATGAAFKDYFVYRSIFHTQLFSFIWKKREKKKSFPWCLLKRCVTGATGAFFLYFVSQMNIYLFRIVDYGFRKIVSNAIQTIYFMFHFGSHQHFSHFKMSTKLAHTRTYKRFFK